MSGADPDGGYLATTEQRALIFEYMAQALRNEDESVARVVFERIKAGYWRIRSVFDRTDDDRYLSRSSRQVVS